VVDTLIKPLHTSGDAPGETAEQDASPLLLSLFCGAGGLDSGFWQAGYNIVLAADNFPAAVRTHARNHDPHGTVTKNLDLSVTTWEQLQALWSQRARRPPVGVIGGPPCQAFSVSNVHQKEDDPRRRMPEHYAQIVEGFNRSVGIDFFLFENVEGLYSSKHAAAFLRFKELCYQAGFEICEKVIDAVHFGLPQYRQRLIVVGINRERFPGITFDIPEGDVTTPVPIDAVLRGLPEPVTNERGMKPEDIPFHPNHWTFKIFSQKFTNGAIQPGCKIGRSFRALKWGEPSWTVAYGHREVHVHPDCHRRLSIYEAMLLQGFPHDYILESTISDQVILVSDAVPPPVGQALATSIATALGHQVQPRQAERVQIASESWR
jgi:DNA (cytosine-5)-methyltransferase 1